MTNRVNRMGGIAAAIITANLLAASAARGATTNFYVRHSGSDVAAGTNWTTAFATIQKALDSAVIGNTTNIVSIQASPAGQFYDRGVRDFGWTSQTNFFLELRGGWENVDSAPAQTGLSAITDTDGTTDERGIDLHSHGYNVHRFKRYITVERFTITNVTDGIRLDMAGGADAADGCLTLRNTTIYAQSNGVMMVYPKSASIASGYGGLSRLTAENVDIRAGLGGSGHGVYVWGTWLGSTITATATNPATGFPRVSGVGSASGRGVYFVGVAGETYTAAISNTVIYGCGTNGMDVAGGGTTPVRLMLEHCTLADNGGDGFLAQKGSAGSWVSATNSIFANNAGHGINAGTNGGPAFACSEGWNNFWNDDVCVNGATQTLASTDVSGDPLFQTGTTGPDRYMLSLMASPSYLTGSDGLNRGAHQNIVSVRRGRTVFRIQ